MKKVTDECHSLAYKLEQAEKKLEEIDKSIPVLTIVKPSWDNLEQRTTYTIDNIGEAKPELDRVLSGLVTNTFDAIGEVHKLNQRIDKLKHTALTLTNTNTLLKREATYILNQQHEIKALLAYGICFGLVIAFTGYIISF